MSIPQTLRDFSPNILYIYQPSSQKKTHFNSINLNNTVGPSIKAHPSNLILGTRKAYSQYMVSRTKKKQENTKIVCICYAEQSDDYMLYELFMQKHERQAIRQICVYVCTWGLVRKLKGKKEENNFQFS